MRSTVDESCFRLGIGIEPTLQAFLEYLKYLVRPASRISPEISISVPIPEAEFRDHRLLVVPLSVIPKNQSALAIQFGVLPDLKSGAFDHQLSGGKSTNDFDLLIVPRNGRAFRPDRDIEA